MNSGYLFSVVNFNYIWNGLQYRKGGTPDPDLEVGRQLAFDLHLKVAKHRLFPHAFNIYLESQWPGLKKSLGPGIVLCTSNLSN